MSNKTPSAVIFGCSGLTLTDQEKQFFERVNPLGFIIFSRNIDTPDQVRALTRSLRETVGRENAPVLIDQEGGRVARLRPPYWQERPAARVFGDMFSTDRERALTAAYENARDIGRDLANLGVNVDCTPVLDVPGQGANEKIIGDRTYSDDPAEVAALAKSVCDGLTGEGVLPVIKHIPGHGRAVVDSHFELPRVEADLISLKRMDFAPFKALSYEPWAMTAHVLYTALDAEKPASLSKKVIQDVIRGEIGFDGFLICDDLSMKALSGSFDELTRGTLDAGCDAVLHCNGNMAEMTAVADAVPVLTDEAVERLERGWKALKKYGL